VKETELFMETMGLGEGIVRSRAISRLTKRGILMALWL
jgi:hypothetical protein